MHACMPGKKEAFEPRQGLAKRTAESAHREFEKLYFQYAYDIYI